MQIFLRTALKLINSKTKVCMKNVFTIIFSLIIIFSLNNKTYGQLLFQEDFVTPTTDITTAGWTTATGLGVTVAPPYIVVNSGSALNYTGYIESGVGNSAYLAGAGQDAQVAFTGSVMSGLVYVAFMLKVDSASVAGDYCIMIRNSSNHNRWRLWLKSANAGANFVIGVSKGGGTTYPAVYTTATYNFGQTYLVVAKYDYNTVATTDALLSLWVNPSMSSFGKTDDANPAIAPFQETGTSDYATVAMNRFCLLMQGAGIAPTFSIGGIRIATDWKTVLPPAPMYYNFSGTGDITNAANWGPNLDGTGTGPSDFASDNQWYLIRNSDPANPKTVNVDNLWLVTGLGSKLIVGAGVNLHITSSGAINGKVDVAASGTLVVSPQDNLSWPTFGTVTGSVNFDNPAGFTLTGDQIIPSSGGYYSLKSGNIDIGSYIFTVKGKLKPNLNKVFGNGTFALDSAGTLSVGAVTGISASAAAGEIQTATRKFSRYGSYEYSGAGDQVTGDGLPDTVLNVTVNMSSKSLATSLSKTTTATGNLGLTMGKLKLNDFNMSFNNPSGGSDASYVVTNGAGSLIRQITSTSVKTVYIGSDIELRKTAFTFEVAPTSIRNISFRYVSGDTADAGFRQGINYRYKLGYWVINTDRPDSTGTYKLDLTSPLGFADTLTQRIIWRADKSVIWDTVGSSARGYLAGAVNQAGIDRFGQFAIGSGDTLQVAAGKRYLDPVFSSYILQSDLQYGLAGAKALTYDLYTPAGDTKTNRPLVIFVHGGGFQGGDKVSGFGTLYCGGLAKRGYVVASINYRTTSPLANDLAQFEAMIRAVQDAKAAVRYFRQNASANGIDPATIYMTGSSAGSITTLHLAYLDSTEVPNTVTWANVGGTFEGTSGTPGVSSKISGVISNWGAIGDTAWIKRGDIPVYLVHGTADVTVFYDSIPSDGPFLYSDKYIYSTAQRNGITSGLRLFYNTGHTLDNDAIKQDSALKSAVAWLYTILPSVTDVKGLNNLLIPSTVVLNQNYPNPFNPTTKISYGVPSSMKVSLVVYDVLGKQLMTLVDQVQTPGNYEVPFNGANLSSGIYFYRLTTGNVVMTKKMMFLK